MTYIIANFKSHKTESEITSWLKNFSQKADNLPAGRQGLQAGIILALPFPYLHLVGPATSTQLDVAAQDVSPFPEGSYTGAVNAGQLKDQGVKYCLVGHSERRRYFHETAMEISNKVDELTSVGITPIICVSDDDLNPQFAALNKSHFPHCLFAYETPADIGGQDTTPVEHIAEIISLLRARTDSRALGYLYGGSVNPQNVASLIGVVDGLLVASASQQVDSFAAVIQGFTSHV